MPPDATSDIRARRLGRLAPDERAAALCDAGTFVSERCDGVVLGTGHVDGRAVVVLATDGRVRGMGAVAGTRAAAAVRAASGPVVLLLDSEGARTSEGVPAVLASADWLAALADASGVVPLIAVIFGVAGGSAAYAAALCDLVVMVSERSFVFVAGPAVVQAALGEMNDLASLGGTRLQSSSGFVHLLADDDRAALAHARATLARLPSNAATLPPSAPPRAPRASTFTLPPPSRAYDVQTIIDALVDQATFIPLAPTFGASIQTGLAAIDGEPVLLVASQPSELAGALDACAAQKLARFVRFAAAFNLPIVTLCDTPGFLPGRAQEAQRILVHGAKVIAAYAEARQSVPLVAVIARRAVGAGAVLAYGAHVVIALAGAEVQQMGPAAAAALHGIPTIGIPTNHLDPTATDPEATGFAHQTVTPELLRGALVDALAHVRTARVASGRRKTSLVPL